MRRKTPFVRDVSGSYDLRKEWLLLDSDLKQLSRNVYTISHVCSFVRMLNLL